MKIEIKNIEEAAKLIKNGWLAQFRGKGWVSSLIQYSTGGIHSHTGMLARNNGTVDLLEVREFKGGRRVPLECQAVKHTIDVFSVRDDIFDIDLDKSVKIMRQMTGKKYGYRGIARLVLQKIPLVWRLWPLDVDDGKEMPNAPFCSHAVAASYRMGGVDPVPYKKDCYVTPRDLSSSLLFNYEFTIG